MIIAIGCKNEEYIRNAAKYRKVHYQGFDGALHYIFIDPASYKNTPTSFFLDFLNLYDMTSVLFFRDIKYMGSDQLRNYELAMGKTWLAPARESKWGMAVCVGPDVTYYWSTSEKKMYLLEGTGLPKRIKISKNVPRAGWRALEDGRHLQLFSERIQ